MKTARDVEIFGVLDRNEPVPEREIEDHEVDVELEIIGLAYPIDHRFGRHQIKADDLAIAVLRLERVRQFDIVDKQHIVADAELGLHAIGDGADRHGILHQEFGDAALLLTLLDERLVDAVAVSHAAGDDVVELVGRDALVGRAAADPEMQAAIDKTVAVEMHAIGAHAEKRHGAAIEPEDRLVAPARHDIKGLVAPFRDIALGDERLDDLVDRGADPIDVAGSDERHPLRLDREHRVEAGERRGIVTPQPADAAAAGNQRHDAGAAEIVAGADVVGEGHGSVQN